MQYKTLLKLVDARNDGRAISVPPDTFRTLLIAALRAKGEFDAEFYLAANPDVRTAVKRGQVRSAEDHYYHTGYFEGRMPKRFSVDDEYYLRQNSDVASAIRLRKVKSCQSHFDSNGFREGRAPYEGFSLF